jgi:hypothetical protein
MEINLHPAQSEVYEGVLLTDGAPRFTAVCCSRGWGKTYLGAAIAVTALYELMRLEKWVPNKYVYIIAPTYEQVIDIYYPVLAYDFNLEAIAEVSSRDKGRFVFAGGTELRLVSYESVERMRGKGKCCPFKTL